MEGEVPMRGKFKIRQLNKRTGESTVILEESNQVSQGMKHALVNILCGRGSREVEDYQFKYFQLGDQNYNLSTFDVSADVPASSLLSNFWTIKSPLDPTAYGTDSAVTVVKRDIYGLGSIIPSTRGKIFDNFVDPPDTTKLSCSYTNNFESNPRPIPPGPRKTTWIPGCANTWEKKAENYFLHPLELSADYTVSGPTFTSPTWSIEYNSSSNVAGITSCLRGSTEYIYNDGRKPSYWNQGKKNQTLSVYYMPEYYASSLASTSGSTPTVGKLMLYNRTAAVLGGDSVAGYNQVRFEYRYDLKYSSSSTPGAAWYPPEITQAIDGYSQCTGGCRDRWEGSYGSGVTGGDVSANVYCRDGAIYTPADAEADYATRNGPGKDCFDTPNSGFGPSGNFYRISVSWNNVPDEVIDVDTGLVSGIALQAFNYPLFSRALSINPTTGAITSTNDHEVTPREQLYIANLQFEYTPSATPYQYIHAEKSYYITSSQDFLVIPKGYTTSLNDNTANVRLLIDEELANNQTIKEVGLFLKNPNGTAGIDNPFLTAYKVISPPLAKNNEFSYIIDWELSLIDSTTT